MEFTHVIYTMYGTAEFVSSSPYLPWKSLMKIHIHMEEIKCLTP